MTRGVLTPQPRESGGSEGGGAARREGRGEEGAAVGRV